MLLLISFNDNTQQFEVNPVPARKVDKSSTYCFEAAEQAYDFIQMYLYNPVAALFAYQVANAYYFDAVEAVND